MGVIRPKVWKSETITLLGLLAVVLVSCTQPRALKQAKQYEARRDYSSAYSNVVAALETSPNNKRLLQERLRIGNLYALEILRQQSLFATNNLYERIQLLQTGLSLDSTNKNSIEALFKDLSSHRTRLLSQAANLQTNQSVDLILTEVEKLSAYCLADSELRMASVGNRMLAEHAAALVRRTADAGEVRFARQLALRGERVFVDDSLKQIRKQLENELRTACLNSIIPPLSNEASLGSRTFVAWAKTLLSPLNEDFFNEYVSLQRALKESSLPVAQVLLSGEIGSDQESALRVTINARAQKAGCRIATAAYTNPPDVVISIVIKDAAYKPSRACT